MPQILAAHTRLPALLNLYYLERIVFKQKAAKLNQKITAVKCSFVYTSWKVNGVKGPIQETMEEFLAACAGKIPSKLKFAVFGCGDPEFTFCRAVDTMSQILKHAAKVYAPLKIDSFYFRLTENTKQAQHQAQHLRTILGK
jgi:flavodoxin